MSRFKNALNARDHHVLTLRVICCALCFIVALALFGWLTSPRHLTIHNPPDLRSGSSRAWWEIPPPTVYAFSFYIFQQLIVGRKMAMWIIPIGSIHYRHI